MDYDISLIKIVLFLFLYQGRKDKKKNNDLGNEMHRKKYREKQREGGMRKVKDMMIGKRDQRMF